MCGFCGKGFESREEFYEYKKIYDFIILNICKICVKICDFFEDLEKYMYYYMRGLLIKYSYCFILIYFMYLIYFYNLYVC